MVITGYRGEEGLGNHACRQNRHLWNKALFIPGHYRWENSLLWHVIGCFDSQVNNLSKALHSSMICKQSLQSHLQQCSHLKSSFWILLSDYIVFVYIICDKIKREDWTLTYTVKLHNTISSFKGEELCLWSHHWN